MFDLSVPRDRPLVMGIVNATPDSFSDGGRFLGVDAAVRHGLALAEAGADVLDVGGESTRPGATPVPEAEEIARVIPVIEGLRARTDRPVSIDTMKPAVARAAIGGGASLWNDVSALRHAPDGAATAAALGVPICLMHMQGAPGVMQADPRYDDVAAEVIAFLQGRIAAAEAAGVPAGRILVDPGIGFGKTLAHNLALMAALPRIASETGRPVLFGASRKRFIQGIDPSAADPADRLGGSLAAALHAAQAGAAVLRVHDVRETVQALAVSAAITAARDA